MKEKHSSKQEFTKETLKDIKKKKAYEKPGITEHEPLEESTAYLYYYYLY